MEFVNESIRKIGRGRRTTRQDEPGRVVRFIARTSAQQSHDYKRQEEEEER